jgi:hypothetical protein
VAAGYDIRAESVPVETEFHESMKFHGISWNFMEFYETQVDEIS